MSDAQVLNLRCDYARAAVLAVIDAEAAELAMGDCLADVAVLAYNVSEDEPREVPTLLADVPAMVAAWHYGAELAVCHDQAMQEHDDEATEAPRWAVQTWESGDWMATPYPTLDEAMTAFLSAPKSVNARLTFGGDIGMASEPGDDTVCNLPPNLARQMLDSHDRIYQFLSQKGV